MPSKRERQIRNKATTIATQDSYQVRETDINNLEALRDASGMNMGEIDTALGEASNWYSNHQRSGGTHEFSRPDYFRIKDLLELEYLRKQCEFDRHEVARAMNETQDWYEAHLRDGFKINAYNKLIIYLVTAAVLQNRYGDLEDNVLAEFHKLGIVEEDFIQELQDSVDIDYGH